MDLTHRYLLGPTMGPVSNRMSDDRMTLHEVAKRAKVSIATVSRTINHVPTVDRTLARRVWRAIEEVGYSPNTYARALVSGHNRVLGLMVSEVVQLYYPEVVQRFADLGLERGYEILLSPAPRDLTQILASARRLIEHRIIGVAMLSFTNTLPLNDFFKQRKVPLFVFNAESSGTETKSLSIDYQHGIRQAVQHLAALGHSRIAFVTGPEDFGPAKDQKAAFEHCMHEIDLQTPSELLIEAGDRLEAGVTAMAALMRSQDPPTAVVCSNDVVAAKVMQEAHARGLHVPRDMSVVGIGDLRLAQFTTPALTTIQVPPDEIANVAFESMVESATAQRQAVSYAPYVVETNLVIRNSTGLALDRKKSPQRMNL